MTKERCGALLLNLWSAWHQPVCVLEKGHLGDCSPGGGKPSTPVAEPQITKGGPHA